VVSIAWRLWRPPRTCARRVQNGGVTQDELHEAEVESRWEAAPAVLLVIALQVLLGLMSRVEGWELWGLPWWIWLGLIVPEIVLLAALSWSRARRQLEQLGHRRKVSLALIAVVSVGNGLALAALIGSILSGQEDNARALLFKGIAILATNVLVFGLWYWELDRGGPVRRREPHPPSAGFQFPQMDKPRLAERWQPGLVDYIYVSFTNSVAFSPTDAMPLTRWAKLLMAAEASASGITILLVVARAVNILN
jgi:hypothetical protein